MASHPSDDRVAENPSLDEDLGGGTPSSDARPAALLSAAVFALIAVLVVADLGSDLGAGIDPLHALLEGGVLALSVAGVVVLWRRVLRARRDVDVLSAEVATWRADAERWRREASDLLGGLGVAIDRQFAQWGLSPAEREVALLLVKGFSHKEIAQVRGTSERTVREQAQALYRKAGVAGRAELAAFFLEDLLLPGAIAAETGRGRAAT